MSQTSLPPKDDKASIQSISPIDLMAVERATRRPKGSTWVIDGRFSDCDAV